MPQSKANDVVRLAEARNPQEAHLWRQVLEEEGIKCQVVGDLLDAGLGNMPKIAPEVWVHKKDLELAMTILTPYQQMAAAMDEDDEEDDDEE